MWKNRARTEEGMLGQEELWMIKGALIRFGRQQGESEEEGFRNILMRSQYWEHWITFALGCFKTWLM